MYYYWKISTKSFIFLILRPNWVLSSYELCLVKIGCTLLLSIFERIQGPKGSMLHAIISYNPRRKWRGITSRCSMALFLASWTDTLIVTYRIMCADLDDNVMKSMYSVFAVYARILTFCLSWSCWGITDRFDDCCNNVLFYWVVFTANCSNQLQDHRLHWQLAACWNWRQGIRCFVRRTRIDWRALSRPKRKRPIREERVSTVTFLSWVDKPYSDAHTMPSYWLTFSQDPYV